MTSLSYEDHSRTETLVQDLERILLSGDGSDVTFVIGPGAVCFPAHSMIVAVRCRTLYQRVHEHLRSAKHAGPLEFEFPTLSAIVFPIVLGFIYTGRVLIMSDNVFPIYSAAVCLGIERLKVFAMDHLKSTTDPSRVLKYLTHALEHSLVDMAADLISFIALNCVEVLSSLGFDSASLSVVMHIVKQEDLSASEADIWRASVRWAACQSGVPRHMAVSAMSGLQRQRVCEHLRVFLRPGYLRILNLDVKTFAHELEPLGLLSEREILLKYRLEAAAKTLPFELSFPHTRLEFLTRVRHRTLVVESKSHPHPRGVSNKFLVELPSWTTSARVVFDPRCKLGRYADLSFFQDEGCSVKLASLASTHQPVRKGGWCNATRGPGEADEVWCVEFWMRRFWFTFYAPFNVGNVEWGYKFSVT